MEEQSPKEVRRNGYALAGMISGIAAVFFYTIGIIPILADVLSSIGLHKSNSFDGTGKTQAGIGLALGIIYTIMYLIAYGHIPTTVSKKQWDVPTAIDIQQRSAFPTNSSAFPAPTSIEIQRGPTTYRKSSLSAEIIRAAYEGRLHAVERLLRDGADPNARGNEEATVLMAACINGNLDIVRILVERGADVTARDLEGWTPLRYARSRGHRQIEDFLRDHGATE